MPDAASDANLRSKVRLRLVLERGASLARVYLLPEVRERTLQRHEELAREGGSDGDALRDHLAMLGDSYRVLGAAAGYAATELRTLEEHYDELVSRHAAAAGGSDGLSAECRASVRSCCEQLEGYVVPQQQILTRICGFARQHGFAAAVTDEELHHAAIRREFPRAADYSRHALSLFDSLAGASECVARALSSSGEELRAPSEEIAEASRAANLATQVAVEYDLSRSLARIYEAG